MIASATKTHWQELAPSSPGQFWTCPWSLIPLQGLWQLQDQPGAHIQCSRRRRRRRRRIIIRDVGLRATQWHNKTRSREARCRRWSIWHCQVSQCLVDLMPRILFDNAARASGDIADRNDAVVAIRIVALLNSIILFSEYPIASTYVLPAPLLKSHKGKSKKVWDTIVPLDSFCGGQIT